MHPINRRTRINHNLAADSSYPPERQIPREPQSSQIFFRNGHIVARLCTTVRTGISALTHPGP